MIKRTLLFSTLALGSLSVIVSLVYGNEFTFLIKPVFLLSLFVLYTISVRRFNLLLLIAFSCVAIGEMFACQDFEGNFGYVALFFGLFFTFSTVLIWPVLSKTKVHHDLIDVFMIVISLSSFVYLVYSVFFISASKIGEYLPLSLATISFSAFIFSCFYIAKFQKHKNSIYLFIVAMGYSITCSGFLFYEIVLPSKIVLAIINTSEIIAQITFIYFLIHILKLYNDKRYLI